MSGGDVFSLFAATSSVILNARLIMQLEEGKVVNER